MRPGTSGITTTRHIHADPTSTALLLAAPSAFELWPGVRRVADVGGRIVVEADLDGRQHAEATVRALPPTRTPTSYVSRFEWTGPELGTGAGKITLAFVPAHDGTLETEATLVLHTGEPPAEIEELAAGFLSNLARAAELRSHAA